MASQLNLYKFDDIYDKTHLDLLKYVIVKCHNINDTQDIMQETYLELWNILNKKELSDINIKSWYKENYPNDNVGDTLSQTVTFLELNNLLNSGYGDVYTLLGGDADTIIRERCFEKLCELVDCNYDDIYNKWINLKNDYRSEIELDGIEKE